MAEPRLSVSISKIILPLSGFSKTNSSDELAGASKIRAIVPYPATVSVASILMPESRANPPGIRRAKRKIPITDEMMVFFMCFFVCLNHLIIPDFDFVVKASLKDFGVLPWGSPNDPFFYETFCFYVVFVYLFVPDDRVS